MAVNDRRFVERVGDSLNVKSPTLAYESRGFFLSLGYFVESLNPVYLGLFSATLGVFPRCQNVITIFDKDRKDSIKLIRVIG